ncbi:hypothetical protein AB0870_09900 [Microbacterium proteolyticum]|uniref:hypothetical protein n=1 Tax=Microbacterium proteolyticum TaxID=1572644 RepID=UPI002417BED3|nr:hypothetical protein [Microbacterium proteolyticum]
MSEIEQAEAEVQAARSQVDEAITEMVPDVQELVKLALERAVENCVRDQWQVIEHLDIAELSIIKANAAFSVVSAKAGVAQALEGFDYDSATSMADGWAQPRVSLGLLVDPLLEGTAAVLEQAGFDPGKTARTVRSPLRVSELLTREEREDVLAPLNNTLAELRDAKVRLHAATQKDAQDATRRRWDEAQPPHSL